ncbi:S8 family serine peptidase [candidate division WOR-3 bacterium]|nr:S8 family serine peptidase [candidate division WOR-3 bacterium]
MRRVVLVLLALLLGASFGLISPDLERRLAEADGGRLPVQIVLKRQFDRDLLYSLVDGMPRRERRVEVARILSDFAAREQADLLKELNAYVESGAVADIRPMWIVNAVYCEATPEVIRRIAARADVHYVNYDLVQCPDLLDPQIEVDGGDEIAWGVRKIRAPEVWAQGFTGAGVVCGHIDTGCDYTHPDLADHMWEDPNYPRYGWNFENNTNDPMDVQGHGTHTAGTVASDGTSGSQCGVAPDARIMVCRVRTVADSVAESQCWQAMQFVVAPPLSPGNGADLYTMSLGWMIAWAPHQATWRQVADNVNAAGVIQIVAAGNERQSATPPNALRCPGNVPPPWWNPQNTGSGSLSGIISIGATDSLDAIAYFSSPGPVTWQTVAPYNDYVYPPGLTKPDVSAPGVAVKSCLRGGGYTLMDGTSMATPHVAGTVCLMLSKNPNLMPAVVDSILEVTAVDLGPSGKDNDFGAGRIDALAAVNYVTGSGGPMIVLRGVAVHDSPPGGNNNGRVDPGESARLRITLRNSGGAGCNNTAGTFRAFDARLTVTDSLGTWGNIPSGSEATNTADPIAVTAAGTIPPGTNVACTLYVTGDSADYATRIPITLRIGEPPPQPGTIIWGPRVCPGMPTDWGLYGVAYNSRDSLIYCIYFMSATLYKYTSDSLLQARGTITLPEDSCTDIAYNAYDNTFWVVANPSKRVYKITPTGSVIRYFTVPQAEYPCGVVEYEATHQVYVSDRRTTTQQMIFVYDTLGNIQDTIVHPVAWYYGTRCLALDYRAPSNAPSLLNMYSFFDASGTTLDSCAMMEIDRVTGTLRNRFRFANTEWNMRGIEYDPRDGSYWVTIMQYSSGNNNQILKVVGFNMGATGTEEEKVELPGENRALSVAARPNPFTGRTVLSVTLNQPSNVDLLVYDNTGRLVKSVARAKSVTTGADFVWDGRDDEGREVARGVYFYRVKSATDEAWGKLVLTK